MGRSARYNSHTGAWLAARDSQGSRRVGSTVTPPSNPAKQSRFFEQHRVIGEVKPLAPIPELASKA
jgi:hypothetical protein